MTNEEEISKQLNRIDSIVNSAEFKAEIADMKKYDGWVLCQTSSPEDHELVLVTDGNSVWMGDYFSKRKSTERWSVVYDGAPPFDSTKIIAWRSMPFIPSILISDQTK